MVAVEWSLVFFQVTVVSSERDDCVADVLGKACRKMGLSPQRFFLLHRLAKDTNTAVESVVLSDGDQFFDKVRAGTLHVLTCVHCVVERCCQRIRSIQLSLGGCLELREKLVYHVHLNRGSTDEGAFLESLLGLTVRAERKSTDQQLRAYVTGERDHAPVCTTDSLCSLVELSCSCNFDCLC